jgi:hypothetical protein
MTLILVPDSLGNQSVDASSICGPDSLNSTCFGGSLPGVHLYHYEGTFSFAPPCDTWTLSWSICCRNTSSNVPSSFVDDVYIETTVNTVTAPCDNSPNVMQNQIAYLCINQQQTANFTATDVDGDSLVYTFVSALENPGLPLIYGSGYSGGSPLTGIVLDPVTGIATVTPTAVGNFIVAVLIESYDSNGNLIGTMLVDTQIIVMNCTNNASSLSAGITNLTGAAILFDSTAIDACGGASFCFDFQVSDLDPNDSLTLTNNLQNYWPGAAVTLTGANPLNINVCWTAPSGTGGNYYLPIQVSDNSCPISGNNTHLIILRTIVGTGAGPDALSCGGAPVQLNASAGSSFTWTAISGDSIVVGGNFSCNSCADPVANPASTTTYVVTSNLSGTCVNTDTVTVLVDSGFTVALTDTGFGSGPCSYDSLQLMATPSVGGTYSYSWSPAGDVSDPSISNPILVVDQYGAYNLAVTITSAIGCVQTDSFYYFSNDPNLDAYASDTVACSGDSIELVVGSTSLGGGVAINNNEYDVQWTPSVGIENPTSSTTMASPTQDTWYFVTATDTATGCLYTDSVLVNFGGSFVVTAAVSDSLICDGDTVTLSASSGGNSSYSWSPAGSIFDTASSTTTATPTQTTSYIVAVIDTVTGCSASDAVLVTVNSISSVTASVSDSLICDGDTVALSANAGGNSSYSWSPAASIFDPTSSTTTATPTQTTSYTVAVIDTVTGCSSSDAVLVTVSSFSSVSASVSDNLICIGDTITLVAAGSGVSYSWSPSAELFNPTSGTTDGTPSTATTFTVVATDSIGCTGTTSVFVDVYPVFSTGAIAGSQVVGELTTEAYSVTGGGGSTFVWTAVGGAIVSGQGTDNIVIDWGSNGVGSLTVVETNQDGCLGLPATLSIDIVTGIADSFAPAMFNFDVHPNPAKAQATLTVVGLTNYQFEILDVTGKLIRKVENIGEPQFAFDVHDLTKGVYFIRVTSGDTQHSETKRLVIL